MEIIRKKIFNLFLIGIFAFFTVGCGTINTLKLPEDSDQVIHAFPVSIALGEINDDIHCDDEAFVYKNFLEKKNIFYNIILADLDNLKKYHNCDLIVTGRIDRTPVKVIYDGPGWFVGVITFGFYYLLGFNYKYQQVDVKYNFQVDYVSENKTENYNFSDVRKYWYGIYGPNVNIVKKPGIYYPGWNELLYRICLELSKQDLKVK